MFKKTLIIILSGVFILLSASYFLSNKGDAPIHKESLSALTETKITIGSKVLTVEIADETQEQAQGLSDRVELDYNSGMLFVFPYPAIQSFWMKDTHFALDLIWIDESGKIIEITDNVAPETYPETFSPPLSRKIRSRS